MTTPECDVCHESGAGVQFPMTPKTEGYKFGNICDVCDDKPERTSYVITYAFSIESTDLDAAIDAVENLLLTGEEHSESHVEDWVRLKAGHA